MKHIGNEISRLFEKNSHIREFALAEYLGMTRQNLNNTKKRSSVDAAMLEKIAKFFNVPITYFFNEKEAITDGTVRESLIQYEVKMKEEDYLRERIKFLEKELENKQELIEMFKSGQISINKELDFKSDLGKSG